MEHDLSGWAELLEDIDEVCIPEAPSRVNAEGPVDAIREAKALRLKIADDRRRLADIETKIKGAALEIHREKVQTGKGDGQQVIFDGCTVDVKPNVTLVGKITEEALRAKLRSSFSEWFDVRHSIKPRFLKVPVTRDWVVATVGEDLTQQLEAKIAFTRTLKPAKDVNTNRVLQGRTLPEGLKQVFASTFDRKTTLAVTIAGTKSQR